MLSVIQRDIPALGHSYAPAGPGPFPALLLLHGSEGSRGWLAHRDAALFAAHGFLAIPYGYSVGDNPWVGGDIWETDLDATEQALAALRASKLCGGKVGVYGWSRGGEHALLSTALLAGCASDSLPDAVAAHAAPDVVISAWRNLFARHPEQRKDDVVAPPPRWGWPSDRDDSSLSAWTWRGETIPPDAPIEIERYPGPIFLSVGDQDEIWPAEMTTRLADRLRRAGRTPEVHIYEGQLHTPDPAGWNRHLGLLLDFFGRSLAV